MVDNPRPAHERISAFQTLYFKGRAEERDAQGNVISPEQKPEVVEMLPVDAKQALSRDPELWTTELPDGFGEADPGDESRKSAHGNTPEEIYANDAATSMRKDGFAAEPAGSRAGRRPGAYSPSRTPRREPTTIVEPAKDTAPKPADTSLSNGRRGRVDQSADLT